MFFFLQKEDAENALRAREMILEEALELLTLQRSNSIGEGWRTRHDEHFDHQTGGPFPAQRFGPAGPNAQMPYPQVRAFFIFESIQSFTILITNKSFISRAVIRVC